MISQQALSRAARRLPGPLKTLAKAAYYRGRHWAHPDLKRTGTVQDLYYWVADGGIDTLLLLQNYFSVLYPTLDTATLGTVTLYDEDGMTLGSKAYSVRHHGCAKFTVSSLLEELGATPSAGFGTLEVNLAIPVAVREHIQPITPFYFWDRFHIGYTNSQGQTCFVHGVDKTHIFRDGEPDPIDWYQRTGDRQWAPEIPVNMGDYKKFSLIMINRTSRSSKVSLHLSDSNDTSLSWDTVIPAKGVRRFELSLENTAALHPTELRMRINGMTTDYGRPVVFKEFHNGAISAMHC